MSIIYYFSLRALLLFYEKSNKSTPFSETGGERLRGSKYRP
jgi:hypothetical protein